MTVSVHASGDSHTVARSAPKTLKPFSPHFLGYFSVWCSALCGAASLPEIHFLSVLYVLEIQRDVQPFYFLFKVHEDL